MLLCNLPVAEANHLAVAKPAIIALKRRPFKF